MDKSLLSVTNRYRTQWMREMFKRDNRSVDAIMIGNLQRSITFFASTTIFIHRFAIIVCSCPFDFGGLLIEGG